MPNPILLVEDEPDIQELLVFTLSRAGFTVITANSAEQALPLAANKALQMAIIDWMLPGMNGVDLAYRLRQDEFTRNLPIIMLTARGAEEDKLRSFASGVDDYMTKPFSPRELIARVKALLRRAGVVADEVLEAQGIRVELDSRRVSINGVPEHLGPTEFRLLEFFLRNPNRTYDRSQLLDRVWGRSVYVEERTVDVHVLRLRKVLKKHDLAHVLQTVRGFGYRFSADGDKASATAK